MISKCPDEANLITAGRKSGVLNGLRGITLKAAGICFCAFRIAICVEMVYRYI